MDHGFRHAAMKPTVRPGAGVRDHDRQVRPILAGRGDNACGWLAGVGRHDAKQNQHFPAVLDQVHGERYCSFCDWRPVEGRQYATNIGKSSMVFARMACCLLE